MTFILSPLTQSCAFKYTILRRSYIASPPVIQRPIAIGISFSGLTQ